MCKFKFQEFNWLDIDIFKVQFKVFVVFVLDNICFGLNVGVVFWIVDVFVLEYIYFCGIIVCLLYWEILKMAIGVIELVSWSYYEDIVVVIKQLQGQGYIVLAVEQVDEWIWLQDFCWQEDQKVVLVFGNEVEGVSDVVMEQVDGCLEVLQYGIKYFLNIVVCVGVVCWEVIRQWWF